MSIRELDSASALVGRSHECAAIDRLLEDAAAGQSGSLVVRGEAGMGKSAMLAYATERADAIRVLRATGVEAEADLAFAGLHGLMWPIADRLPQLPEPQRDALAAALGVAAGEGRDRFLVCAGALSLLAAAAEDGPILCAIDDAQWLDVPSADALTFVARRLVAEGVVIVFGAREDEARRFDAPGLAELEVAGLDRASALALLARSAPDAADSARERLLAEANGNPLALLELPAGLSARQLKGQARLPETLPLTARLRAAFAQRVETLPESTRDALLIASMEDMGELAVTVRAAKTLGLAPDALDPAEEAGLIRSGGGVIAFRHPLVRAVVRDAAPPSRRQRAHTALAGALDDEQHADRALWHRAMATPIPDERIAAALEGSARQSQLRGGHASAATAFERAAELSAADTSRATRLAAAAEAAWAAGQADRARGLLGRSLPLADRPQRARLLYLRGVIEGQSGWLLDGVQTLKQAIALAEDASLKIEMLREACSMANQAGAYDDAIALGLHAEEVACRGDADRFTVVTVTALAAELAGDYSRGAPLTAEAVELAERLDDPQCLIWAAYSTARESTLGAGLSYATRAVDIARERAVLTTLPFALQVQGAALIGQSRFDLAYATAEEGRRLAVDVHQPWAAAWNVVNLAVVAAVRGAEEQTLQHVEELRALVATSGASSVGCHVGRALGLLELGLGRPARALEHQLVMIAAARPESNPLFIFGVPDAVEAAVRCDRFEAVADHLNRFERWVQRFPNSVRLALLERCRALTDDAGAEAHFERARELAGPLSPFDRARTELLYDEWLRRHRRRVDARGHLRVALELFQQLAVLPWESRARSELRASGESARKRDDSTRDRLTPQELQIARLVASGKSNPDVAAQLFLSPRTIDYHLRKVFSKLEIASRTDLSNVDLGDTVSA